LVALAEPSPAVVSGSALLDRVWPNVVVVNNVVYQAIAQLRKALGDDARSPRYIECVPRRGYRLVAEIADGVGLSRSSTDTPTSCLRI
jgi:DNA-binding winged helix-turn-helix (wHTH) protein